MLTVLLTSNFVFANAQVDTSTVQKLLQYVFQPLDKNQINTGFLEEYGCPIIPQDVFNGILSDSNRIDENLWRTLYFQMQTSWTRPSSNPLPTIISINPILKANNQRFGPKGIPILIGSYNTIKTDALSSNLLTYSETTKQIYDVSNRSSTPYNTSNIFASCPLKNESLTGSDTFIVKNDLIWNISESSISSVQIDFANGEGFRPINIGAPFVVQYADTGMKRWTIKVTLSNNNILQCYSQYYVLKAFENNSQLRFVPSQSQIPSWGVIFPVSGLRGGALVSINYSRKSFSGTLRKPLVIVEGFDVSTIAPSLQSNYSVTDFLFAIGRGTGSFDFNAALDDIAGYDLVFIDFFDGAADIIQNAAAVQEVIRLININKVNDDRQGGIRQQNVVIGLSMGGLCARYALADMTKNSPTTPTETKLLITHDSPHRGANVPLGLQYMIRMFAGVQLFGTEIRDIYADYDDAISLLDAPATKQLLTYRSLTANTFENNTFLDGAYRNMITFSANDPQPSYRFVATAQGNECANPLFTPGKTFINLGAGISAGVDFRLLFFRVPIARYKLGAEVEAYALPNTGSTNKIARVYAENRLRIFGIRLIAKQLYENTAFAPGNHIAVDGVPGSTYPLLDVPALNQLSNFPRFGVALYLNFPFAGIFNAYFGAYAYNQGVSFQFTFVPVASALDASPYNQAIFSQKFVGGFNGLFPSTSQTFIAQETVQGNPIIYNNLHLQFTQRNAQWMYNEMEGITNTLNCSSECSNTGFTVSGSDLFCNSGTLCISGAQPGTGFTWTAAPSTAVSLSPQSNGTCVNLTRISSGKVTLTATSSCGIQASRVVHLGGYSSSDYPISGPSSGCRNQTMFFSTNTLTGATNYFWTWPSNWTYLSGQGTPNLSLRAPNSTGTGVITVRVANNCDAGGSPATRPVTVLNCTSSFRLSPNPANNTISLEVSEDVSAKSTSESNTKIQRIRITDLSGNIRLDQRFSNGPKQANINISQLRPGNYNLSVFDGATWETISFIKQ